MACFISIQIVAGSTTAPCRPGACWYHSEMNGNSLRALVRLAIVAACVSTAALAQLPSNASLKGAYYVRYLGEDTRNGGSVLSFSGTMTFDGAGKYTLSGAGDNSKTTLKFNTSGA